MIEANVEIYEARAGDAANALTKEAKILHRFRKTRSELESVDEPMTGRQKSAVLATLIDAREERDATIVLVDEAFDATEPITEGDE